MSFWNRLRVSAVLWATFLLATGILDAFVHIETLDNLIFHSAVFCVGLTAAFLLIAPLVVHAFGIKLGRKGSTDENA